MSVRRATSLGVWAGCVAAALRSCPAQKVASVELWQTSCKIKRDLGGLATSMVSGSTRTGSTSTAENYNTESPNTTNAPAVGARDPATLRNSSVVFVAVLAVAGLSLLQRGIRLPSLAHGAPPAPPLVELGSPHLAVRTST